ncbi:hypothetical protein E5288_WYG018729 [Bos mutus]|uniref:Uncharacterized protein n=1 Tax=Bos mutus TaxID=72004 RepID=A0A6B0R1H8_9CETA|nr:hypothetical protein [Bos mutus]
MAGLGWQRRASRGPWALLTAALLYAALGDVVRSEQQIPLSVVKLWASAFGGEIKSIAAKYSGSQLLQKELLQPALLRFTTASQNTASSSGFHTPLDHEFLAYTAVSVKMVSDSSTVGEKSAVIRRFHERAVELEKSGGIGESRATSSTPRRGSSDEEIGYVTLMTHLISRDMSGMYKSKARKYKEYEKDVAIEEIDGLQLVKKLAKNMEEMFHKKSEAVRT